MFDSESPVYISGIKDRWFLRTRNLEGGASVRTGGSDRTVAKDTRDFRQDQRSNGSVVKQFDSNYLIFDSFDHRRLGRISCCYMNEHLLTAWSIVLNLSIVSELPAIDLLG